MNTIVLTEKQVMAPASSADEVELTDEQLEAIYGGYDRGRGDRDYDRGDRDYDRGDRDYDRDDREGRDYDRGDRDRLLGFL